MKKSIITVLFLANTFSIFAQNPPSPKHSFELSLQPFFMSVSHYTLYGRPAQLGSVRETQFLPIPFVSFNYYRKFNAIYVGGQLDALSFYPSYVFLSVNAKFNLLYNLEESELVSLVTHFGARNSGGINPFLGIGMLFSTKRRLFFRLSGYYVFLPQIKQQFHRHSEMLVLTGIGLKLGKYKNSGGEK